MFSNKNEDCDNELYNTNLYYYNGCERLIKNVDNLFLSKSCNKVNICIYEVINKAQYPFLQFLLLNDKKFKNLSFPTFNISNIPKNINLNDTISLLSYIQFYFGILFSNVENISNNILKGFYFEENTETLNVFYDFSNCEINLDELSSTSKLMFVLLDEIINKENICNIKINSIVTDFFLMNQQFLTLTNKNGDKYEIPVACYVGKEYKKLHYTYFFGEPKMDKKSILGPYYYFTDFNNSLRQLDNKKGGLIRFAIFLGKTLVKLNYPEDNIDNSIIKREKIETNLCEKLTIRLTDYEGLWAENYDSCFIGNIELDNGDKLSNTPIFTVKKYEQQFPLSYFHSNSEFNGIK